MRDIRHGGFRRDRFAGPLPVPDGRRFKNLFSGPAAPDAPPAPVVTPPPTLPDPMSPDALAAKRAAIAKAGMAGRSATTLTTAASRAGGTLAGSAGGQKLGG